jgi:hypothetical protein
VEIGSSWRKPSRRTVSSTPRAEPSSSWARTAIRRACSNVTLRVRPGTATSFPINLSGRGRCRPRPPRRLRDRHGRSLDALGGLARGDRRLEPRQPFEPLRQVPVGVAEQRHRGRQQDRTDRHLAHARSRRAAEGIRAACDRFLRYFAPERPVGTWGLDSQVPTCESLVAKSLRALGFVGTRHFRGRFSPRRYALGRTKKAIAAYWQPTAPRVSTWKSSWYPNTCG